MKRSSSPDYQSSPLAEELKALIDHMPFAIIAEDSLRHVSYVNNEFCRIFAPGKEPESFLGRHSSVPMQIAMEQVEDARVFVAMAEISSVEKRAVKNEKLRLKNGSYFERDYIPVPMSDQSVWYLSIYRDVTERKKLENSLLAANGFEGVQAFDKLPYDLKDLMALKTYLENWFMPKSLQISRQMPQQKSEPSPNPTSSSISEENSLAPKSVSDASVKAPEKNDVLFDRSKFPVVDQAAVDQLYQLSKLGDPTLIADLTGMFKDGFEQKVADLKDQVAKRNLPLVRELAHGMKSSCGVIGLKRLWALIYRIEQEAANGEHSLVLHLSHELDEELMTAREAVAVTYGTAAKTA